MSDARPILNLLGLGALTLVATGGIMAVQWNSDRIEQSQNIAVQEQAATAVANAVLTALPENAQPDSSAEYPTPSVSDALATQVEADDHLQLTTQAENTMLNDILCQRANQIFFEMNNQAIASQVDVEAMVLDRLRQETVKLQGKAQNGGYNGSATSTHEALADSSERMALQFVLTDIRASKAEGQVTPRVRTCVVVPWPVLQANSDTILHTQRARAAQRSEAVRALQRVEVAHDGQ